MLQYVRLLVRLGWKGDLKVPFPVDDFGRPDVQKMGNFSICPTVLKDGRTFPPFFGQVEMSFYFQKFLYIIILYKNFIIFIYFGLI